MLYYRLCKGVNDIGRLIPENDDIFSKIDKINDWYLSSGKYTEEHIKKFRFSGSVKGFSGLLFDELYFDFDGPFEKVKQDCISLCKRLIDLEITQKSVGIFYSGNKGFHVTVQLNGNYSIRDIKSEALKLVEGLETADIQIYNDNRIFRLPGSINKATGLFKTELTYNQLVELDEENIRSLSKNSTQSLKKLPCELAIKPTEIKKQTSINTVSSIDWSLKPKFLSKARYSLQEGYFESGERNSALLCLAATYKNLGFQLEHTYRILKGVAAIQAKRTNSERYSDEELYNNVCLSVYSNTWRGGQFSEREEGNWLNLYAKRMQLLDSKHTEELSIDTSQTFSLFKSYAKNYKNNIIYSGIPELDKHCKFLVGTSNAIVASPGTGKSSIMLSMLNYNSLQGIPSVCFSLDMFHALLSMRLSQKHTGLSQDQLYQMAETNTDEFKALEKTIQDNYKNVRFCFKAGIGIDEIVETINDAQEQMGQKVKLVYIDYNELVLSDKSDPTSASAEVIQSLRRIANELEVCVVTLLQPSKNFSNPADEVTSFNAAKGSSAIAQSLTVMLGLSRPGFDPLNPASDRFLTITCVKNRNGPLFNLDFIWAGLRGEIYPLEDADREELFNIRARRDAKKESKGSW